MKDSSVKPTAASILTINGGSSSIKFALFQVGKPLKRGLYGNLNRIGLRGTNLTFHEPASKHPAPQWLRVHLVMDSIDRLP
jgi:acetate kinase